MMRRLSMLAFVSSAAVLTLGHPLRSNAQSIPLSSFTLAASPNPVGVDSYTTLTATVTGPAGVPAPDGNIDFYISSNSASCSSDLNDIGTSTIASGTATLAYYVNTAGAIAICANYSAIDTNYAPATAGPIQLTVYSLNSISPALAIAGSGNTNVTLNGLGFDGTSTPQIYLNNAWVSLPVNSFTATQILTTIPAADLSTAANLPIQVITGSLTSGLVTFQVYSQYSVSTTVSANPSAFTYGSTLISVLSGTATRTVATDAATPTGPVNFLLKPATGPNIALGTAQLAQVANPGAYFNTSAGQIDSYGTQKLISMDLNGDGNVDAVGMPGSSYGYPAVASYLQVFLSTGANAFQTEEDIYTVCDAVDFAVGDINNDGIPDLVVVCPGPPVTAAPPPLQAYYMLGNGDGTFQSPVQFGSGSFVSSPSQVVLGNFNNDGYNDIAVIDGSGGFLEVISPFATDTYGPYTYFDISNGSVISAGAADLDQDGTTDIVIEEYTYPDGDLTPGAVLTLLNTLNTEGEAGFTLGSETQFSAETTYMQSMTIADVNGDGYPDVAIADPGSNYMGSLDTGNVLIFENDGIGNLPLTLTYPAANAGAVAGAPFPLTGQPAANAAVAPGWNLVYSAAGANGDIFVTEIQRQSANSWTQVSSADTGTSTFNGAPGFIVTGDMNGDGFLDYAATGEVPIPQSDFSLDELLPYYYGNDAQATLNVSTQLPAPGAYTLKMNYAGNQLFHANNTATTPITIAQGTVTGSVAGPGTAAYGTLVTLSATITGVAGGVAPTGNVTFFDGANQLGIVGLTPLSGVLSTASYSLSTLSAGAHTIQISYSGDPNYAPAALLASTPLNITQVTPTVTWPTPAAITYGTALSATQLDASTTVAGSFAYTPASGTVLGAGSQTLSVTFTPTDTTDYAPVTTTVSLTVNEATLTVRANNASRAYDTANPTFTDSITGFVNGDTQSVVSGAASLTTTATLTSTVGSYPITAAIGTLSAANYTFSFVNGTLTITQVTPTITWPTPAAITYGTALSATQLDATSTVAGSFAYTPASGTVLGAGTQTLSVTLMPTDSADYATVTKTVSLTVNKATLTVKANNASRAYDTANPTFTDTISGFVNGDTQSVVSGAASLTTTATLTSTAGTYPIAAALGTLSAANYTFSFVNGTLTITQVTPTITWPTPAAITYGTALSATQLDATSTVAGSFAYTPASGTVLGAGSQTLSVTFTPTDTTDYATVTKTVSLTVNKATLTVKANNASRAYDTANPTFTDTITGFVNGDTQSVVSGAASLTTTATLTSTAGTYPITAAIGTLSAANYTFSFVNGTLTITQGTPPTITWPTPAAITYGTALSATQLDASTTVAGSFAYTPALGTVLGAGSQTLSVTFTPTDTTDYATVTKTVSLTVNKATLTVKANNASRAYDTANPTFTDTITGFVNGDTQSVVSGAPSLTTTATLTSTAGTYPITAAIGTLSAANYTFSFVNGTLTITQGTPPTITWPTPAAITYGTALSATQLDASSTVAGSFAYTPASGTVLTAGSQTLSVTFTPTDTTDYSTVTKTVSLTVNKATLTVKANNASRAYDTANPTFTDTITGFVNGDTQSVVSGAPSLTTTATLTSTAGTYPITAALGTLSAANYTFSFVNGTLTITQGTPPTITWPTPAAITYGTALSATQLDASSTVAGSFAYTPAAGTVLGAGSQTLSVTFTPTDTTDYATVTKTVSLTVNKATLTVTANIASRAYDTANPTFTDTITGFVNGDTQSVVSGAASLTTTATLTSTAGTYPITAALGTLAAANYTFSFVNGTLTITQGTPAIIWPTHAAIIYGTQLGSGELNATASVAGTFTYSPAAGTILPVGSHTLGVTFTPSDTTDYKTTTATITIQVNQATPVITWPSPGTMSFGTPLSSTQLDATATPPGGTFTYSPPAGTTLPLGNQTLSATYVPIDTIDYATATATTTVDVIANLALTSITPTSAPFGSPATTITLSGTGFTPTSVVQLNGKAIPSAYANSTQMTAQIPASFFQQTSPGSIAVYNPAGNTTSASLTFSVALPNLGATFSGPSSEAPGEQPTLTLTLAQAYPLTLNGTMTLTVEPLTPGGVVDPSVQFSSGGTTFNFTIPAGSTTTPTIAIQTGTVAATITVTLTLEANGQDVTPPGIVPVVIKVPATAPVITGVTLFRSGDTITVTVMGFSSTRDMGQANFDFTASPGSSISDPELKVDVSQDFTTWYTNDSSIQYGSSFSYEQEFNLSNSSITIGGVSVTLTNSVGESNSMTAH